MSLELSPSGSDEYLTEIAALQNLISKFRGDHNTLKELKQDLANMIEAYHDIAKKEYEEYEKHEEDELNERT